jgi:hypothetical protein
MPPGTFPDVGHMWPTSTPMVAHLMATSALFRG